MTSNNRPEEHYDEEIERIVESQIPTLRAKASEKAKKCWELTNPKQAPTAQFVEMEKTFFDELEASLFANEWGKKYSKRS